MRSLIAWTELVPLSSRAEKIISLEEQMEDGNADALEHEIGRQRGALHLGIESDHRDEEEQRREHRQRPGDDAGDDRVAVAGQVAQHRQDHHRADDVVAGISEAARAPSRSFAG